MEFRKWVLPELHWHPNSWNLQWHSFCQGQVRLDSLTIKSGSRMTTASTLAFTLNFPMYPVPPPMMRILLIPAIEKYYIVKTYWKFLLFTSEEMLQWAFTWLRSQQDREREERAVRLWSPEATLVLGSFDSFSSSFFSGWLCTCMMSYWHLDDVIVIFPISGIDGMG